MNATPRRPSATVKRPTTVGELLDLTPDLPPLPAVAMATHREAGRPGASPRTVGAIVGTDPALAARILRLANSAHYGSARQIASVPDAVTILGMNGVQKLCMLAGSYPWLQGGLPAYGLKPGDLLTHSLAAAIGTKAMAMLIGLDAEVGFTAGLLHDLGKVGLAMWFRSEDGPVKNWREERIALGFDHAQIGGELARRWNLPTELVNAIGCHHMPCDGLEDALYLGDLIAYLIVEGEVEPPDLDPLIRHNLTMEQLASYAKDLMPDFVKFKALSEACS